MLPALDRPILPALDRPILPALDRPILPEQALQVLPGVCQKRRSMWTVDARASQKLNGVIEWCNCMKLMMVKCYNTIYTRV